MYLWDNGINFVYVTTICIECWNCYDTGVCLVFHFIALYLKIDLNFPIETPTCDFRFKILSMENNIDLLSNQNLLNTSN